MASNRDDLVNVFVSDQGRKSETDGFVAPEDLLVS